MEQMEEHSIEPDTPQKLTTIDGYSNICRNKHSYWACDDGHCRHDRPHTLTLELGHPVGILMIQNCFHRSPFVRADCGYEYCVLSPPLSLYVLG